MERKDPVTLSQKEQKRLRVISEVEAGRRSAAEAAGLLGLSQRQVRRLRAGFEQQGAAALAHGNRGRPAVHRLPDDLRLRVISLAGGRYAACNDSHLREMLALNEGIILSRATIQRLRRGAGQKPKQRRRPPRHRSRRDRRPQEGMLLQIDGSPHHWLGEDQPRITLVGAIDDATSKVVAAVFREQEDAQGYFLLLKQVLQHHGIPFDLYHDRHSIFQDNSKRTWGLDEELQGRREPTQFGRALAELGIGSIAAHSPEAKGRIERLWRTLQDRLVAELALAGVKDIRGANRFLTSFVERFNARFAVAAEEPGLVYRPLTPDSDLERILSFRYQRTVARDNTVQFEGRFIQIPPGPGRRSYFAARVWVHEFLDGSRGVWHQGRWLTRVKAGGGERIRAKKRKPEQPERAPVLELHPPSKPSPSPAADHPTPALHPWRRWQPGYLAARTESQSS